MPRDLGNKHVCFKCETKFYDMKKPVALCPKCGADQRESPAKLEASAPDRKRAKAKRNDDDLPTAVVSEEFEAAEVPDEEDEDEDEVEAVVEDDAEDVL